MLQQYLTMRDMEGVEFTIATEEDTADIFALDYTKLNAVSTCPTWGIVRYIRSLAFNSSNRVMALDAGSAAHEAYAACRLWQLGRVDGHMDHMEHHGRRLFGADRWQSMRLAAVPAEDERTQMLNFCLDALYTSGFYDDPADNRRTIANIEEALIAYLDRWDITRPVYVYDVQNPASFVGIEIPINVKVVFRSKAGPEYAFRLTGRADGLHWHRGPRLCIHDNKTASRLNDAWAQQWHMSHQMTGYCIGVSTLLGEDVSMVQVMGMSIPMPRSYDYGGLINETVFRRPDQYVAWMDWALFVLQIIRQFNTDELIYDAPQFTHSCSRYFRPCPFIPYCASPRDEKPEIMAEMVHSEWDVLAEKHDE